MDHCYVGRKACGCIVAVTADREDDTPALKRETAKDVADWIKRGLTVDRLTDEAFRNGPQRFGCKCAKAAP